MTEVLLTGMLKSTLELPHLIDDIFMEKLEKYQGPVVQSIVSLTSLLVVKILTF